MYTAYICGLHPLFWRLLIQAFVYQFLFLLCPKFCEEHKAEPSFGSHITQTFFLFLSSSHLVDFSEIRIFLLAHV